jgi:hypothetical protein
MLRKTIAAWIVLAILTLAGCARSGHVPAPEDGMTEHHITFEGI